MLDTFKSAVQAIKEISYVFGLIDEPKDNQDLEAVDSLFEEEYQEQEEAELTIPWETGPFVTGIISPHNDMLTLELESDDPDILDETYLFRADECDEDSLNVFRAFCEVYNKLLPDDPVDTDYFYYWMHSIDPMYRASMMRFYAQKKRKPEAHFRLQNPARTI